jgi:hypothetical protein
MIRSFRHAKPLGPTLPRLLVAMIASCAIAAPMVMAQDSTATSSAITDGPDPNPNRPSFFRLDQFGPIQTPEQAEAAFDKAAAEVGAGGGGVIVIPRDAPPGFVTHTATQRMLRLPEPPAPLNSTRGQKWGVKAGVLVYDMRHPWTLFNAMASSLRITRTLKLPVGQFLPTDQDGSVATVDQSILRGTSSYRQVALSAAEKGAGVTVSVPTIEGLFPGQVLSLGSDPKAKGTLTVRSLSYDKTKGWQVIGDLSESLAKGQVLTSVTHTGGLALRTSSNGENQTFDMMVWLKSFGPSPRTMVKASYKYMGDNASPEGGIGTVLYHAEARTLPNPFEAVVESFNVETGALVYTKESLKNGQTLASGRPLINLTPSKVVHATALLTRKLDSIVEPGLLTPEMVGWYAAVVGEADEAIQGSDALRWRLITNVDVDADGKATFGILGYWWGASSGGSMGVYLEPGTDKPRPVKVLIAPGAMVYDGSDGMQRPERGVNNSTRTVRVVPRRFAGTPADFAPGDRVVQAVGPTPWQPAVFRSWLFENVEAMTPAPMLDVINTSQVQRGYVMHVHGSGTFEAYMHLGGASPNGIVFNQDVPDGALILRGTPDDARGKLSNGIVYPGREEKDKKRLFSGISVSDTTGKILLYNSSNLGVNLSNQDLRGTTGLNSESGNFRALEVNVELGKKSLRVTFAKPESSADYTVIARPNWVTNHAIKELSPEGFTVIFDRPAPQGASVNWLLTR